MEKSQLYLLFLGQSFSLLASILLRFTLSIYVLDMTGRIDMFATMLSISILPAILLLPFGGVLVDRFQKKRLMIIFDALSISFILSFFYLINMGYIHLWLIGILLTIISSIHAIDHAAVFATIPNLVNQKQFASTNGMFNSLIAIISVLGPLVGGFLYNKMNLKYLILICMILFLIAILTKSLLKKIPIENHEDRKTISVFKDIRHSLSYMIKTNPRLMKLILFIAGTNLMIMPFIMIGVPYILRIVMDTNDILYGTSIAILQAGSIIGAISIGIFSKHIKAQKLIFFLCLISFFLIFSVIALTPKILSLGYYPSYILLMFSALPIVVLMTIITILMMTTIQKSTDSKHLGKVVAIATAIISSVAPLGQFLFGKLFHEFSNRVYIPMSAIVLLSLMLVILSKMNLFTNQKNVEEPNQ